MSCAVMGTDFSGCVHSDAPDDMLTQDYFQKTVYSADANKDSAWISHFAAPENTSDINAFYARFLGKMYFPVEVVGSEYVNDTSFALDIYFIRDNFANTLTWNEYNALSKTKMTSSVTSRLSDYTWDASYLSIDCLNEDFGYWQDISKQTMTAYGFAVSIHINNQRKSAIRWDHPAIISGEPAFRNNYVLLKTGL